jgi:hypothetical protein
MTMDTKSDIRVIEDTNKIGILERCGGGGDVDAILALLQQDLVVLLKNIDATEADELMRKVADRLGLGAQLELQAAFAAYHGHRHNIGKYFMSVDRRYDYQIIPPHSEGNSFVGMQLAAFYCYENSTDGGVTILMNVDGSSAIWQSLRENVRRGKVASRSLSPSEIARVRGLYQVNMPADALRDDDQILEERSTDIPGLTIFNVLAKPRKTYSRILSRDLYVLWDSISNIDGDSANQYANLLRQCGLLKEPPGGLDLQKMDNTFQRHVWRSGVDYSQIFKCKITLKLSPGDFVLQNNLTWAHSVSNWSPESGTRKIAAAFA